jgi:hypothetical protein
VTLPMIVAEPVAAPITAGVFESLAEQRAN